MVLAIITHVPHGRIGDQYFAYSPYVREMNIWLKYVDEVIVVAPMQSSEWSDIHLNYDHSKIDFRAIPKFDLLTLSAIIKSILVFPKIAFQIFVAMQRATHLHLRCPGNVGLIACLVQIFFPNKIKTAKYAGNWDPNSNQPWSYRLQRWILSNTFLTKNMQVLVYGEWEGSSKNIKPFFTASYKEDDKVAIKPKLLEGALSAVYVGTLSAGKRPLYSIQLIESLRDRGVDISLSLYGDGAELDNLRTYIDFRKLHDFVFLRGNQTQDVVKKAYQESHFVLLPSVSEGWPKVIAEGMFWGCVPIATKVSCVPDMLDYGNRGLLLTLDFAKDVELIYDLLQHPIKYQQKVSQGIAWSRNYTLNRFESEIKNLLLE